MNNRNQCAVIIIALLSTACSSPSAPLPIASWTLSTPEAAARWTQAGIDLGGVEGGALTGHAVGGDPILWSPSFVALTSPFQWVDVRIKSDQAGNLLLFWALTTEDPYGGFRPNQMLAAALKGDGAFHTYRFFPLWRPGQSLLKLRVDPPPGSRFALQSVNVFEEKPGPGKVFRMPAIPRSASPVDGRTREVGSADSVVTDPAQPISTTCWDIRSTNAFTAATMPWLAIQATSQTGGKERFGWLSSQTDGLSESSLDLESDGAVHTYNISMAGRPGWTDKIMALALLREPGPGHATLNITPAVEPVGSSDVIIRRAFLWNVGARSGKDAPDAAVVVDLANLGGKTANGLRVTLSAPPGLRLIGPASQLAGALDPGDRQRLRWTVHADNPVMKALRVTLQGSGKELVRNVPLYIPAPTGHKSNVVPEPHPLPSNYDVGMYYFPGWWDYTRWRVLDEFPERTPVLGYYREGDPEVADWHLKWMAEHGVRFIAYDWYWNKGSRSLTHALENGYFKSHNRRFVKFCLLWANHNPAHTSSADDLHAVTQYWLDNYFHRSEYYTIDGKPVVIIFSPGRFTEDMGAAAVRESFAKMREQCKAAGLPGLFLIACASDNAGQLKEVGEEGYDAVTGYNYPGLNVPPGENAAPYSTMVPGYAALWKNAAERGTIPYIAPTAPGWDNRPWASDRAMVRTGSTPALFHDMLEQARQFADAHPIATKDGPRKVVLVEAWNEFGEGDYVEPCRGYGFGMLDAIRDVFGAAGKTGPHVDVVPADLGMGPYELKDIAMTTAWRFAGAADPEDWGPQNMAEFGICARGIQSTATNDDPAFIGPGMDARASIYHRVEIEMSVDAGTDGQLFWATSSSPFSETQSLHFPTIQDGKPHTYVIDVGKAGAWSGHITQLRVDPTTTPGSHATLIAVKLTP